MHLDPPESFPQPPSFFWLPIDDQRHAAGIQDRNQPPGILITMLCRRQLTQTQVTDAECSGRSAVNAGPQPKRTSGCRHSVVKETRRERGG